MIMVILPTLQKQQIFKSLAREISLQPGKKNLFPVVNKKFQEHQEEVHNEMKNTEVVAGGTVVATVRDTPPNMALAAYFYTNTYKVIDLSVVQVTEVKNSNDMELEGLKRCLDHLHEERVVISKLATDRHVHVRAHMKKERPQIKHNFDVWHLAKYVQKKLTSKAQTKQCVELKPWIQASLLISGGAQKLLKEMVRSVWRSGSQSFTIALTSIIGLAASTSTNVPTFPS